MQMDRSAFFGLWNMYSGAVCLQLVLHEDGTYGESVWAGAQQVWGQWQLGSYGEQTVLELTAQGAMPPFFLNQFGPGPVMERHAVMNVQANQIQLYDAMLVRQYVPTAARVPVMPVFPPMPVAAPVAAYSAPAPFPQPVAHAAPILNQLKTANTQVSETVAGIQAQIAAQDLATSQNIQQMYANETQYEIDSRKRILDAGRVAQDRSVSGFELAMHGIQRIS
jgi:hypothetical protein